jgi:hypothetical protein
MRPNFIRLDLFPAKVTLDGEVIPRDARFVATDDTAYVYVDSSTGPSIYFQGRLEDFEGRANIGWTINLDGGSVIHVVRASSCGCGSRLRGFTPFPGVPYQAQ